MSMRFHQKRFFAYPSGAPYLHTLNAVSSHSHVLVTTDRSVSLLSYGDACYSLRKVEVDALLSGKADVVASAVIERPEKPPRVVVVYGLGENLFLQVVMPPNDTVERQEPSDDMKLELERAPTNVFSVKAAGSGGEIFYGVMACCTDSIVAFGYIENEKVVVHGAGKATEGISSFVRLDNEQFGSFFPEFATFTRTVLAVDIFTTPEEDQGWIAFGCADGLVRVFHGQVHNGCLGGPYKTKDLQLSGPLTSVALFPKRLIPAEEENSALWRCKLLVTCAIGQAVVYEDVFNCCDCSETLIDSDTFDSIFAGIVADINLDGQVEVLLGTDSQVLLAYKEKQADENKDDSDQDDVAKQLTEAAAEEESGSGSASPVSPIGSLNIWNDEDTTSVVETPTTDIPASLASALTKRRKWERLPRSLWDMEAFGAIYSLLWRDVNHDGVPELLVASSTGVYVYEADPVFVIQKLERVLAALELSATPTS